MDFESKAEGDQGNVRFPHMNFMDETIEQLSIFQNKEVGQYRNIKLDNLKKDQMYAKRLELSVDNLNQKLSRLKSQHQKLKNENASLKASNDNHIFINEKLNKALQKMLAKNQQLADKEAQHKEQLKEERQREKEQRRIERRQKRLGKEQKLKEQQREEEAARTGQEMLVQERSGQWTEQQVQARPPVMTSTAAMDEEEKNVQNLEDLVAGHSEQEVVRDLSRRIPQQDVEVVTGAQMMWPQGAAEGQQVDPLQEWDKMTTVAAEFSRERFYANYGAGQAQITVVKSKKDQEM